MSNIIEQLKSLKTDPNAGWVSSAVRSEARGKLMEAIGHYEEPVAVSGSEGGVAFLRWAFADFISKPIAVGAMVFALAFGGWMGTVKASSSSLPGDTLYNLKLVAEQAQLSVSSLENRAVLHTEFAQRRLQEAVAVSNSNDPKKEARVATAMDAFKKELETADTQLQQLKQEGSAETAKVASAIDQKIDELSSAIDQSTMGEVSAEAATQIVAAKDVAQGVSNSAVDVIVDSSEESNQGDVDMDALFRKELSVIKSRQITALGRAMVVENVLNAHPEIYEYTSVLLEGINSLEYEISNADQNIPEAMNLMAAGGFRGAFDIIRTTENLMDYLEGQLVSAEISVTNAMMLVSEATDANEVDAVQPEDETNNSELIN